MSRAKPRKEQQNVKYFILAIALLVGSACQGSADTIAMQRDPDPVTLWTVNTQPYFFGDMGPVTITYDAVAKHLDWDVEYAEDGQPKIEAWREFVVHDLIAKESGGCPAVRGGTLYNAIGDSCDAPAVRGKRSDSGFGQVTPVLYRGTNTVICKNIGLCSWQQIIETPWNSMLATLTTVDELGSGPWCYNSFARSYHNCSLAPDR